MPHMWWCTHTSSKHISEHMQNLKLELIVKERCVQDVEYSANVTQRS